MKTRSLLWAVLLTAFPAGSAAASAPAAEPVTTVTVENISGADRPAGPVTFGMIFAKSDVEGMPAVEALPAQVDVKRRWPDGSVKHAILTVALPALPAGQSRKLALVGAAKPGPAAPEPAAMLTKPPDLAVQMKVHNGPAEVASLAAAAGDKQPKVWLNGKLASEVILKTAPTDPETGKPDPDLEVRFHVRHYPAAKSTRVVCVVENCKWSSPGSVPYDVSIRAGGKELFAQKDVGRWPKDDKPRGHTKWTRWVKRFWFGRPLDDVHVRYDVAYLTRTGLLPRYDPQLKLEEKALARMADRWRRAETAPLQRGSIMAYFPTTGGREDIGPLPTWTARYLISQDRRAMDVMLGNGDFSGSCPVHIRDAKTDWVLSLDDHPGYSLNARGTKFQMKPRDTADTPYVLEARSGFSVDAAHQPSLAYVPYLITGDYYYLEEMEFWAAFNMVAIHYAYRKEAAGLLTPNQVRGVGWSLRNLADAAALAPDGSKGQAYFEAKLANNLKYLKDWVSGPEASPLGTYKLGASHAYTRGWSPKMRGVYFSMPPWQHNFLTWAAAHVADLGYADADAFRDYMMKFTIGLFTHPDEITPYAGSAYFLFVGERRPDGSVWWYDTWKDVHQRTYFAPGEQDRPLPTGIGPSEYTKAARGVLIEAVRAGRPDAQKALDWISQQVPQEKMRFDSDPTWAFRMPQR
ncbi:MAG: hypothetical protein AMJ81_14475 [Phycisphaerae bacterium SM23_33]|nr:MAG: hypothetical protein AMJ81_14475 [Phycisphaerae bacterium SM23_33]